MQAAEQPVNGQQHAEVIELQRQRSLEIEAHLAQVRLLMAKHLGQVEHIQDYAKSCELQELWPALCLQQEVLCRLSACGMPCPSH